MRPPAVLRTPACEGMDMDIFFPPAYSRGGYSKAKAVCSRCPVMAACLRMALATNCEYGMFGGTTPADRKAIRDGIASAESFEPGHGDKKGTEQGYDRERRAGLPHCEACCAARNTAVQRRIRAREAKVS